MNAKRLEVEVKLSRVPASVEAVEDLAGQGKATPMAARKVTRVYGSLTPKERQMLQNAARFCPVGQYFAGSGTAMAVEFLFVGKDGATLQETLPGARPPLPTAAFDEGSLVGAALCTHVAEYKSQVVVESFGKGKGSGPWGFVVDERPPHGEGVGPPPTYVVMAALAASTSSTVAALARRRHMAVDSVQVEVTHTRPGGAGAETKEAREEGWAQGRRFTIPAWKRVTVRGDLGPEERLLLQRASTHCPVSQLFMGIPIEEELVEVSQG